MLLGGFSFGMLSHPACQAQTPASAAASAPLYQETYRPQFHFTAKQGWLNDPNGLVYFDGEYHQFFQFETLLSGADPKKSWGNAVSTDLVHWHQIADAIVPDALGPIWSGSAVVDWDNTSGFGSPGKPPLVAFYTAGGGQSPESQGRSFTQCLAYSVDRGRTWTKDADNPVLPHVVGGNRDPKVIWYAPTRRWIMALYLDGSQFGLFSSPDLKSWTQIQTVTMEGSSECPDFFPIPLEGTTEHRWVFTAADSHYMVGTFDGKAFTAQTPPLPGDAGANFYAAQTFSGIPVRDGRRIQIAWMNGGTYPNMPFNQQMSFPCTLTLHQTPDGPRLYRWPVREVADLYGGEMHQQDIVIQPGTQHPIPKFKGDFWDVQADFVPTAGATAFGLRVRGTEIRYQIATDGGGILSCLGHQAALAPEHGRVTLRFLLDRTSLEVYGNRGKVSMSSCFLPSPTDTGLSVYAEGGAVTLVSLTAHSLRSAWAAPSSAAVKHL